MPTDTQVNELIINVLTQEQYDGIENPSNSELYLVPDVIDTTPTPGSTNTITSDGVYEYIHSISWYGTSSTPASTVQKEVSIPSITKLINGQIIIVKPTITSTVANSTLKLNNFNAYPMRYDNAAITTSTGGIVWNVKYPSVWVFDGSYWVFVAHGVDSNTTYSVMSVSEGTTGTATSSRVVRADYLKQIIKNLAPDALSKLSDVSIATPSSGQSLVYDETISKWVNTEIDMSLVENTTYSQLVSKIAANNGSGSLEPGKLYRITDYTTTTKNGENPDITSDSITYKSVNHPFDLIVTAISSNKLDCRAKAIQHEGDTYFSNSDLSKWQIWYDINNDTNKYDWADSTNGKGVIYRMIDERNNDLSYDFKNILFKRKLTDTDGSYDPDNGTLTWVYTFGGTVDSSLTIYCYNNILKENIDTGEVGVRYILPNNVFLGTTCAGNTFGLACSGNTFGEGSTLNTFGDGFMENTFGDGCYFNTFGSICHSNIFGDYCYDNTFGDNCSGNSFGEDCSGNSFGEDCSGNSFGDGVSSNTFKERCANNTFGDNCYSNTFENGCRYITFGDSNNQNGNYIRFVTIKNGNQYIRLYNSSTASDSNYLQNIYIAQGVNNSDNYLDISTIARNLNYRTTVGRATDGTLRIYNEDDPVGVENVTYSQLVTKIASNSGAGSLEPGKLYRITDYVATTKNGENPDITSDSITYKSANHPFDLIVTALSPNKLDCQAKAVLHSGDTYFSTSDLSKWQIWYDVNNDTNTYEWADSTNGKGVIYRMIDERNNDFPYDFKNILFKRKLTNNSYDPDNGTLTWVYTFGITNDASLTVSCFNNILKENIDLEETISYSLPNNVFLGAVYYNNTFGLLCYGNTFGDMCVYNTFGDSCINNTFGEQCIDNTFGIDCSDNTFVSQCQSNTFGESCYHNTFGDNCYSNTFGNICHNNTFGDECEDNTFGYACSGNTFGNDCYGNTLVLDCSYITFGDSNNQNGNYIQYVTIESGNQYIRLYNSSTASDSNYLQNIYIAQGVNNSNNYLDISTIARNLNYRTTVAKLSNGTIRIYKEDEDDMLPSMNGNAGKVLTVNSNETGAEWNTIVFPDVDKVKQVLSASDVYGRLMITANNTATASGSIVNNAVAHSYYSNLIMANPTTGDVVSNTFRAKGNDVYIGSSTNSQCHQQYDATNKCLKFIFD